MVRKKKVAQKMWRQQRKKQWQREEEINVAVENKGKQRGNISPPWQMKRRGIVKEREVLEKKQERRGSSREEVTAAGREAVVEKKEAPKKR